MLSLVETSRLLHFILLCWNASEHFLPQIYSAQTPWGTTGWDAGAAKGRGCKPEKHLCWHTQGGLVVSCSWKEPQLSWEKVCMRWWVGNTSPRLCPLLWEKRLWERGFTIEIQPCTLGLMGEMQCWVQGEETSNPSGTGKFSWWVFVSCTKKTQGNIYLFLPIM